MTEFIFGRDGEFVSIIQAWIEEAANAVHFQNGNECVPVGYGTPCASPGMLVVTRQVERIRDQCCAGTFFPVTTPSVIC